MTAMTADPGEDKWPPGFRFHPTDEELVAYYLKRKMCRRSIKLDVITETDVYKWDPDELPGQSMLKTGDRQWFFFSPRDRKYPNGGGRSNRATAHGYWKATGKDRNVTCSSRTVGVKKTLVFYRGRAPTGDRTDWVMHEYTLDEEELKRCQNVKDYYALYKVYKKSGPGPKNGEQYGAPFKEEEWADEETRCNNNEIVVSEVREKQPLQVAAPVNNLQVVARAQPPADDIDEFMKRILDEPLNPQQQISDFAQFLQAVDEEDSQITLVDPSSGNFAVPHSTLSTATNGCRYGEQVNFGLTHQAPSNPEVYEAPEATSATSNWSQAPHLAGEEGFLEIDDLKRDLSPSFDQKPVDNLELFQDFDELFDAAIYQHDAAPLNYAPMSQTFNIENGVVNQPNYHLQSNSFTDQEQYQLPSHTVASQVDYQFQANPEVVNQQVWTAEQNNVFTSSPSFQAAGSVPNSGVANESVNLQPEANQNNNIVGDGADPSWMSSMIWSFVESIPTTPASASESPLVNRAFERMSSFSRLRINPRNNNITAAENISGPPAVRRTTGNKKKKGFLVLSIIGALIAVMWVFFGTVRIMGRAVFS